METYTEYPAGTRTGAPRAARLILCNAHQYMTFHGDCEHGEETAHTRYAVIGTDYGHLHNTSGGWRLWNSPSSAYRAAREYVSV